MDGATDRSTGLVAVLGDKRYRVIHPWNRTELGHLSQLAVDSKDRVYAFQRTGSPIVVLTPEGEFAGSWGNGVISDPHRLFITPDDPVLLVDRHAPHVLIFGTPGRVP